MTFYGRIIDSRGNVSSVVVRYDRFGNELNSEQEAREEMRRRFGSAFEITVVRP